MMVYKETFPEGKVAIIEVQPSVNTPVRYKGVIWIRVGARKAEANTEEERILTEKGQIHSSSFDGSPCHEATIDDIDIDLFKNEYLPKAVSPMPASFCSVRILNIIFRVHTYNMSSSQELHVPQKF